MSGPFSAPLTEKQRKFFTDFNEDKLPFNFNYVRNPIEENYILDNSNSRMILQYCKYVS